MRSKFWQQYKNKDEGRVILNTLNSGAARQTYEYDLTKLTDTFVISKNWTTSSLQSPKRTWNEL